MKSSNILKIPDILNNQNIALIGHMGSGKTLIGKLLAQKIIGLSKKQKWGKYVAS
jgi:ABC-type polysaccharide/polyol phosphate transport system ATPase subunit